MLYKVRRGGYTVINPNSKKFHSLVDKVKKGQQFTVDECVEKIMKPIFFKALSECDIFAHMGYTWGVMWELNEARRLKKKILKLDFEDLDIDEINLIEEVEEKVFK